MAAVAVVEPRRRLGPRAMRRIAPTICQAAIFKAGTRLGSDPQRTEELVKMRKKCKNGGNELNKSFRINKGVKKRAQNELVFDANDLKTSP
jgi:hypothetical protein